MKPSNQPATSITISPESQTGVAMNESNIKSYFAKLIELQRANEPFPVDLDLVWPIAYTRRDSCTKELIKNFIEGIDYQLLRRKAERTDKFRQKEEYRLSVSCMEYLIVRKVRSVFDVYSKMFKISVNGMQLELNDERTNAEGNSSLCSSVKPEAMNKKTPLEDVKAYLIHVKELAEQGDEFPVDVDDVWELAYCAKRRVTDKLLGINFYNTNFVDGIDYKFVPTTQLRGKFYLSVVLFEKLIIIHARHLQGIYKEVFNRKASNGVDTNSGLSVLPRSEFTDEHIFRKKSEVADAFQQLVIVQSKLDSIKDRDSLQRVMLVLSDYNMLLNRIHPNNE